MKLDTKSLPKQKLIEFIRSSKMDEPFSFVVEIKLAEADNFVHRMRVELSRFREQVKAKGRVPKQFKVLFLGATAVNEKQTKITLMRAMSKNDISSDLDKVFDQVAGGKQIV